MTACTKLRKQVQYSTALEKLIITVAKYSRGYWTGTQDVVLLIYCSAPPSQSSVCQYQREHFMKCYVLK